MTSNSASPSTAALWAGRILTAIPVLIMLLSGIMKIVHPPIIDEGFKHLGIPINLALGLGILEVSCAIIYAIPRTAVIGAILLTGYFGGAMLTSLRVGEPWIMQFFVGVLAWGGLWLRDLRLRALLPLVR